MFTREQINEQIERLIHSEALHNSESLCKLLRYLSEQSVENPGGAIKEYQIATEVFHRSADFDPQLDSVIRVQAGRLRNKLAGYYAAAGEEDRIIVELPKGNYALHFRENPKRTKLAESQDSKLVEHAEPAGNGNHGANHEERGRRIPFLVPVLSALLLLAVAALALVTLSHRSLSAAATTTVKDGRSAPAAFQAFWGQFLTGSEAPWVVFSNASFVGRPETGLRYYSPSGGKPDGARIFDHYTGVGEVLAVHDLDDVFASLHGRVRVKRGSLFSLDDLRQNNLIFLGSPAENLTLRDIPSTRHFVFKRLESGPRAGDLAIATIQPQPGEPEYVLATPSDETLTEDYAIIGLKQGLESPHLSLIIAGTTTFGTEGAVEFLCRQETLETLLDRLNVHKPGELHPFEALLRIRISRGVPVETTLVAVSNN